MHQRCSTAPTRRASTGACCVACATGRALPAAGYDALLRERPRAQAALAAELGGALAVLPTAPHVAPKVAPLEADDDHFLAVNTRTLRATLAMSYLDMPGVSLPIGPAEDGLPGRAPRHRPERGRRPGARRGAPHRAGAHGRRATTLT